MGKSLVTAPRGTFKWILHMGQDGPLHATTPQSMSMGDGSDTPLSLTTSSLYIGGQKAAVEPQVKSASFTAANGEAYHITATATVTDPTPVEGKGYVVILRNGTATVGATAYATAGTLIHRIYHSGAWASYAYQDTAAYVALTGNQTIAGVKTHTSPPRSTGSLTGAATEVPNIGQVKDLSFRDGNTVPLLLPYAQQVTANGGTVGASRGAIFMNLTSDNGSVAGMQFDACVMTQTYTDNLDFSRRMRMKMNLAPNSTNANSQFYAQIGRFDFTATPGQLASKGFGFGFNGTTLTPFVHNGSGLTSGTGVAKGNYAKLTLDFVPGVGLYLYGQNTSGVTELLSSVTTGLPTGSVHRASGTFDLIFYNTGTGASDQLIMTAPEFSMG